MKKQNYIPNLTFCWEKDSSATEIKILNDKSSSLKGLNLYLRNCFTGKKLKSSKDHSIFILGSPIIGNKINLDIDNKDLINLNSLKKINGEFMVILFDKKSKQLKIINDRFASIPIYYADSPNFFLLSTSYSELIINLKKTKRIRINKDNFFEFIYFQRLLGDKTYDYSTKFLSAGSELTVNKNNVIKKLYWEPNFSKTSLIDQQLVDQMVSLLKQSINRKTSDNRKYGLFLSGGFDSRSIAMASEIPLKCLTYGFTDNFEVNCARKSAKILNKEFYFIKLPSFHLSQSIKESSEICNGMYVVDNALFTSPPNYEDLKIDVMLNGHGFDYMFQGMYLPNKNLKFLGKPTFFKKMLPYQKNISEQFINTISFRLKYFDLFEFLHKKSRKYFSDIIYQSCEEVKNKGKKYTDKNSDLWEYFIIHSIGRHYSWPNIGSQNIGTEIRSPSFDNDLFDFYLTLRPEHRLSAKIFRKALIEINKKCSMIESGNFGISLASSPLYKTSYLIYRKILRSITNNPNYRTTHAEDRTWPDRDRYLFNDKKFFKLVEKSINSDLVEEYMPYFNWKKIRGYFEGYKKKPELQMGSFLITILSLNKFLEKI